MEGSLFSANFNWPSISKLGEKDYNETTQLDLLKSEAKRIEEEIIESVKNGRDYYDIIIHKEICLKFIRRIVVELLERFPFRI